MNILRHLEFIRAAEDEGGAPEPEAAEDTNALAETVVEAAIEDEPEPPPVESAEPAEKPHHLKGKTPWYMDRIHENQNKAERLAEELAQEKREKAEALALLERQSGNKTAATTSRTNDQDIQALVNAGVAREIFNTDCNVAAAAWREDAGDDFKARFDTLSSTGLLPTKDGGNTEFLMDVFAVDKANAHKILDMLALDPERAIELTRMDSRQRIAKLTRMTMAQAEKPAPAAAPAPKPAPVSKVPAPKPVVDAANGVAEVDEDKMSDAEWSAWRKRELTKQRA